jgi:N-methylhydantoinase B
MNVQLVRMDPILVEVLRTRLEAIGQEAGAAVQQTAISPIVTESRDFSVTICSAEGDMLSATGVVESHFGAAMHAVRSTIARYGEDVEDGDVFIANDPHTGGGLHPQDVVVQRPVFSGGKLTAWVAIAAHMMDMGGMVPGSSAVLATECFQEALRLPPVRLARRGEEVTDVWAILLNNIRTANLIEMDIRSLVVGTHVAGRKLAELAGEIGVDMFAARGAALIESTEHVFRERIARLEDGDYTAVGGVEFRQELIVLPCTLTICGDRMVFDLTGAPPQVPHFINSKPYTVRSVSAPNLRPLIGHTLPVNQALYNVIELQTTSGSIVDCVAPAPIGAAHMDCAQAVGSTMAQCLQLAVHASPKAWGREFNTAPSTSSYATGRWSWRGEHGARQVFTLLDGAFCGSAAAFDHDGVDVHRSPIANGNALEYADVEIIETAYPLLFHERLGRVSSGGYGKFRGGAGCHESFSVHRADDLVGNLTGTRAWFPAAAAAGGLTGGLTQYALHRADGTVEPIDIQAVGLQVAPGERFELMCATGGGFGDPLDRSLERVNADVSEHRIGREEVSQIYGVAFGADGLADAEATRVRRDDMRRERLSRATPAAVKVSGAPPADAPILPFYPGVVQKGDYVVAEDSGAVLAQAPGDWLDGCMVIEEPVRNKGRELVARAYLDPLNGRQLFFETVGPTVARSIRIAPSRWTSAARA